MRIGGRAALGLVAACLTMTACSGDPDDAAVTLPPTTETASAPSPPPSTTAPPTAPIEPTPTTTETLSGGNVPTVDNLVAEFFQSYNAIKETRDFAPFDALYLPQCIACLEMRVEAESWLANGQTATGGNWVIVQQRSSQLADGSKADFTVLAFREAVVVSSSSGEELSQTPSTPLLLYTGGLIADEPWIIEDMGASQLP